MTTTQADSGGPLVGVVGVTYTGNMGGQVMLHAVRQQILDVYPKARFRLFSIYPEDDRKAIREPDLEVAAARPARLVLFDLPLALLQTGAAKIIGKRAAGLLSTGHVRRLKDCDIIVDLSGIAFVATRGLPLLAYNLACTAPSFAADVAHFKLAQSLGPFGGRLLRSLSRWVFSRCRTVIPRGRQSSQHLHDIGFDREPRPDVSFALKLEPRDVASARALLPPQFAEARIAMVSPSRVTRRSCDSFGADYIGCLKAACLELVQSGYVVLLVAHSVRAGSSKNNDLGEIDELLASLEGNDRVVALPFVEDARVLRALFALSDIAVTSRFHATVAALSGSVPPVTIGWNYKYEELLSGFECAGQLLGTDRLTPEGLTKAVRETLQHRPLLRARIAARLPDIVAGSAANMTEPLAELGRQFTAVRPAQEPSGTDGGVVR